MYFIIDVSEHAVNEPYTKVLDTILELIFKDLEASSSSCLSLIGIMWSIKHKKKFSNNVTCLFPCSKDRIEEKSVFLEKPSKVDYHKYVRNGSVCARSENK